MAARIEQLTHQVTQLIIQGNHCQQVLWESVMPQQVLFESNVQELGHEIDKLNAAEEERSARIDKLNAAEEKMSARMAKLETRINIGMQKLLEVIKLVHEAKAKNLALEKKIQEIYEELPVMKQRDEVIVELSLIHISEPTRPY